MLDTTQAGLVRAMCEPVEREKWAAARRIVVPHPSAVEFHERGYREYLLTIDRARSLWGATS
ncbi:hypothetical protein ACWDKQ_16615 [Saccharopolyspora sp. NPDC000995]